MAEKQLLINIKANIKQAQAQFAKFAKFTNEKFSFIKNAVFSLQGAIAGLSFGLLAKQVKDTSIEFEKVETAMQSATGSAGRAKDELEFVREEAERLGFEYLDLADSYTKITAASRGTNLEGQATRDIFSAIAETARTMNLEGQDLEGMLRAVEQMMSKGNVQAEELRGQLGERLPGAFQIAARAMGVTTDELNKLLDRGEVTADELLPRMAAEMHKVADTNLDASINSTTAEVERFNTSLKDTLKWLDDKTGISFYFKSAAKAAREFMDNFRNDPSAKAMESFNQLIKPNIKLLREFGVAVEGIDPTNIKEVNRILKAAELNNIDLKLEVQLSGLASQIEATAGRYRGLLIAQKAITQHGTAEEIAKNKEQLKETEKALGNLSGAYIDAANAKEKLADVNDSGPDIKALDAEEKAHMARLALLSEAEKVVRDVSTPIEQLSDEITFLNILFNEGVIGVETYTRAIKAAQDSIIGSQEPIKELGDTGKQTFNDLIAATRGWGNQFTDTLADAVIDGKASFADLRDSIIRDLLRIQIQKNITDPFLSAGTDFLSQIFSGGAAVPAVKTGTNHTGGIVGAGEGGNKSVSPFVFAGAQRYHTGGIVGDEVPIIAKRKEGVFTEGQMKALGSAGASSVRIEMKNESNQNLRAEDAQVSMDAEGMVVKFFLRSFNRGGPIRTRLDQEYKR